MKEIKITDKETAFVDDEDFEYLNQFKWNIAKSVETTTKYATRTLKINGKWTNIRMHIEIVRRYGYDTTNKIIHHKDENGLNNCKENLKLTDHSFNRKNRTQRRPLAGRYFPKK